MDMVLRAAFIYLILIVVFRISGRRTLLEMNSFDFILLLIISEACQQAILGEDFSAIGATISIVTLIGLDLVLSWLKDKYHIVWLAADGPPLLLVDDGKVLEMRLKRVKISHDDLLTSARKSDGILDLDHIRYAILEQNGKITIIPKKDQ
ncbi:DUF421 domain-containing protein [Acerihabitans arboris]|uniref:DUF421 domain-containing protein n=1 Tax=Acerihabitans arboris TaxID=2691583 RepID=A0A845SM00_9GAMM|nr:YetF domain-containing protein [Acerihabitans arboris]NDL64006.1 DUF421 domain-containing protein [Acerihabitans arboris]